MTGGEYRQAYDRSMTDPDGFWREAASLIDRYTEPETARFAGVLRSVGVGKGDRVIDAVISAFALWS